MNLLNLASHIQERLLFLPGTQSGRDLISEREMRPVCERVDWEKQSNVASDPRRPKFKAVVNKVEDRDTQVPLFG